MRCRKIVLEARVGAHGNVARGYDPYYYTRQTGKQAGQGGQRQAGHEGTAGGEQRAGPNADYYLSAAEELGEPDGTWLGEGLAELGIHDGDRVRPEDFEPLYSGFQDPRDPTGKTTLGAPPRSNAGLHAIYQAKADAEPGATKDRLAQLWMEARAEYEGPVGVMFWDTTFSVDKTISLAHASAKAEAQAARQAGDLRKAQEWEERAAGIWAEIEQSVRLFVRELQPEAGVVRTGHHGRRVDGVEAGRFEDAQDVPVAIFPQHTNREGEPQLHVHALWLNKARTVRDGQWRAIDSRGLHRAVGGAVGLAGFALESGLSRRFGFDWIYRPASKARVIAGVPEKAIHAFSSRRTQVTKMTQALAERYERERGHAPSRRALASMRQFASYATRKGKGDAALDFTRLLREWEGASRKAELGTLRDLASVIWRTAPESRKDATQLATQMASRGQMTYAQERHAMATGAAQLQEARTTWTRSDLMRSIAQNLPDHVVAAGQEQAMRQLNDLTDRALAGEGGEDVMRLDAPEWPRVPDSLRRASGESIYRPHGGERYATATQLALEDRLLSQAQADGAPRIPREMAATLLGADLPQLEARLASGTHAEGVTQGGLRVDQATAAFVALTSSRRVELIVGPAGTGKTYSAVRIAEAWKQAGLGRVYGVATTSAGRNVMLEAGIEFAENTAQFLGHLPGQREARGATDIGQDALLILDEASMTSMADLAAIIRYAEKMGAKVIVTGDHGQLSAVEGGGGMEMLARKMGFAQLTEAVRFRNDWEGDASLAIRAGDVSALAAYDGQGRLHGGTYEEMAEQAARAWLAEHLAGTNVLLTAYERKECADLNRRIQGYLLDWEMISADDSAELAEGATAHTGDLIIAGENDNKLAAPASDHMLANGDLLRVDGIAKGEILVSRQLDETGPNGERLWTEQFAISKSYAANNCDLGYALTTTKVEGRTVSVGLALGSDKRSRNETYTALTRGALRNEMFVYPSSQEPQEGISRSAPDAELIRERRLEADRNSAGPRLLADERDPVGLLAQAVRRTNEELAATETRERALSNADHLGLLYGIWTDRVRAEAHARYAAAIRELLPADQADDILADPDSLWRTVRNAELAGRDGAGVLAEVLDGSPLTGARSYSAVLDARVRKATEAMPPLPRESWRDRLPRIADPDEARYLGEVADAMDARQVRIGQHAAAGQPLWATQALGELPDDQAGRAEWERRAGQLGAYREMFGYDHPGQAIGPEPGRTSPEARAEWYSAFGAMARVEGIDVRHLSDGQLLARRRAYEAETSWAPKYVAEELRAARRQEQFSKVEQTRHQHEARAAARKGNEQLAGLHEATASSWLALGQRATQVREVLAQAHDTRREWEVMTEPTRRLGRASDIELHHRNVLGPDELLRSAEPEGFLYPEPQTWVQPRLGGGVEPAAEPEELTPAQREERTLEALGLTLNYDQPELPSQVSGIAEYNRRQQERIDERRSQRIPSEDPDEMDLGEAWTVKAARQRDAVIQPPRPEIPATPTIVQMTREREGQAAEAER